MKTISLEAAKLLGLPFGWRGYRPHRFTPTEHGFELKRYDYGWVDHYYGPDEGWLRLQEIAKAIGHPYLIEEEDLESWAQCSKTKKELEDEGPIATRQLCTES